MIDAQWIAEVLSYSLRRPSLVPPRQFRELRDLTRYRKSLIRARTSEVNRLRKVVEHAGVKLATVATDVLGVFGREMMRALIAGVADPDSGQAGRVAKARLRTCRSCAGRSPGSSARTTRSCIPAIVQPAPYAREHDARGAGLSTVCSCAVAHLGGGTVTKVLAEDTDRDVRTDVASGLLLVAVGRAELEARLGVRGAPLSQLVATARRTTTSPAFKRF